MLNKIVTAIQIVKNILLALIVIWVVLYGLEKILPSMMGESFFFVIYHLLLRLISIGAVLLVILTLLYAIGLMRNKNKT